MCSKNCQNFLLLSLSWALFIKYGASETCENVYLIMMISRNPRLIVGFNVASDKLSERIQNIIDNSPETDFYYTDGYLGYINVIYLGKHIRNVRDKKDTHNVESINTVNVRKPVNSLFLLLIFFNNAFNHSFQ